MNNNTSGLDLEATYQAALEKISAADSRDRRECVIVEPDFFKVTYPYLIDKSRRYADPEQLTIDDFKEVPRQLAERLAVLGVTVSIIGCNEIVVRNFSYGSAEETVTAFGLKASWEKLPADLPCA